MAAGGGGRDPRGGEGILAPLFRKWAERLLERKLQAFEGFAMLTPDECVLRHSLRQEFDNIARSTLAAQRIIREHSDIPLIRFIV